MILSAEVATTLGRLRLTFEPVLEDGQPVAVGRIGGAWVTAPPGRVNDRTRWYPLSSHAAADLIAREGLQRAILEAGG